MKKAFTLAEMMIVLIIIGVLAALLLPSVFQVTPDQAVLKFKKSNSMLGTIIRELVNSDRYYSNGDLGTKSDGSVLTGSDDEHYFCQTLADILNTKRVNCEIDIDNGDGYVDACNAPSSTEEKNCYASDEVNKEGANTPKAKFDEMCVATLNKLATDKDTNKRKTPVVQLVTADNVYWFEANTKVHFGTEVNVAVTTDESGNPITPAPAPEMKRRFSSPTDKPAIFHDKDGFDRMYKVFCFDVDGFKYDSAGNDVSLPPFGYGIRADGRIIPGARADEYIKKDMQGNDED